MTEQQITALLEILSKAINASGPWKDKRRAILDQCTETDKANLEEFTSWFETVD